MNEYFPDKWILLEYEEGYAVFAGWRGGYLSGDSWRRSTLIKRVHHKDDGWVVETESGSVYILGEDLFGMTMYMQSMLSSGVNTVEDIDKAVEILSKFKESDYES